MVRRVVVALGFCCALAGGALAQSGPPSPFVYTCGDYLAAESNEQRYVANLMVYWMVGYMHGRFAEEPRLTLDAAKHDSSVNDIVNTLKQVCVNVPDMALATFADNLAGDLAKSLQ
jgi:hypothetical protein